MTRRQRACRRIGPKCYTQGLINQRLTSESNTLMLNTITLKLELRSKIVAFLWHNPLNGCMLFRVVPWELT